MDMTCGARSGQLIVGRVSVNKKAIAVPTIPQDFGLPRLRPLLLVFFLARDSTNHQNIRVEKAESALHGADAGGANRFKGRVFSWLGPEWE